MQTKSKLFLGLVVALICLVTLSQPALAYTYETCKDRARASPHDLGGLHGLLYTIAVLAVVCGVVSLARGKLSRQWGSILGGVGVAAPFVLGIFLIVVGLTMIPWGSPRLCAGYYLHDPAMAPLGIGLLVVGIVFAAVHAYRELRT